jgi:superfamily II DNA or RNA helicase
MLKDVEWSEDRSYKSGGEHVPFEFFLQALCNSNRFDLLLGYFSSAAINILSLGFATFLYNGGKVRMIVNNILSQEDKDAFIVAEELETKSTLLDLSNIKLLKATLDDYGRHFFECLAWLIANERIELKIIRPKDGQGISHYKNGVFYDDKDYVGFSGTCNFTAYGLLENLERLEVFLSWENSRSSKFVKGINYEFGEIFSGNANYVEYLGTNDIETAIQREFGDKAINELLIQEAELIKKRNLVSDNKRVKKALEKITSKLDEIEAMPRFPYIEGPREYQRDAYNNWCNNGFHGIFAMATGTGKTITALNCLLQESLKNKKPVYHALILVPTITLVSQWEEEARKFNFQDIIKVSSKTEWESDLATTLSTAKRINKSFIIITTYASFIRDRFFKYMKNFPVDSVLIADEAHNIGSPSVLARLPEVTFTKRIGLSATPKRIYDPEGSLAMEEFFKDQEPYTYTFSMDRAIEEGILCKYYYFPHIVTLADHELGGYIEISKKLAKFFNKDSGTFDSDDIVQKLLLKRKRIIHKAENKLQITKDILQQRFNNEHSLRYTFIYVPEGKTVDILGDEDETEEDIRLINQYTREIAKIDDSIMVNQFISGMPDRNEILEQFKEGKIQVIASMKCLDEGVDIPRAEHAIFCSSTGNPRQFIQRRGRILRKHTEKSIAVIHDLVVIPNLSSSSVNSDTYNVERKLVEKELERVMYFASLAINPYETERVFAEVCSHYDLNIYTIHNKFKNS